MLGSSMYEITLKKKKKKELVKLVVEWILRVWSVRIYLIFQFHTRWRVFVFPS